MIKEIDLEKLNLFLCLGFIIASHCDFRLSSHILLIWILLNLYNLYKFKQYNLIKKYYRENKMYINSILVFFMLPFVAVVLHGLPGNELSEWSSQFRGEMVGIVIPFLLLKNRVDIKKILGISILMVNISMFYGYYKYINFHYFNDGVINAAGNVSRLSAFITGNPNVYSMYLLILFCVIAYTFYYLKEYRIVCGLTMLNIFISLVIAMSRGCILLFFAALTVFLIYRLRKNLKSLIAALCIICIGFGGVLAANPSFSGRIVGTIKDSRVDTQRYVLYSTAINIIEENWFSGIGQGNFRQNFREYNEHRDLSDKTFARAHQIVLEMMVNSGIFGLIAFLGFIIFQFKVFFREYFKNNNDKAKKYAALMCLFITGIVFTYMQVENVYFALRKIYWIYVGLGYYVLIQNNKNQEGLYNDLSRNNNIE